MNSTSAPQAQCYEKPVLLRTYTLFLACVSCPLPRVHCSVDYSTAIAGEFRNLTAVSDEIQTSKPRCVQSFTRRSQKVGQESN